MPEQSLLAPNILHLTDIPNKESNAESNAETNAGNDPFVKGTNQHVYLQTVFKQEIRTRIIYLGNLRDSKYSLIKEIPVEIESREDIIVAKYYDLDIYGSGDTEQDAIGDLCSYLVVLYEALLEDKDKLGPFTQQQLNYFSRIIKSNAD